MKKIILIILILVVVVVSGCVSQPYPKTEGSQVYTCPDGTQVTNLSLCKSELNYTFSRHYFDVIPKSAKYLERNDDICDLSYCNTTECLASLEYDQNGYSNLTSAFAVQYRVKLKASLADNTLCKQTVDSILMKIEGFDDSNGYRNGSYYIINNGIVFVASKSLTYNDSRSSAWDIHKIRFCCYDVRESENEYCESVTVPNLCFIG